MKKMGYGDRSKIFHAELADMIDFIMNESIEPDVKDYRSLIYNIREAYYKYLNQSLLDLRIKN